MVITNLLFMALLGSATGLRVDTHEHDTGSADTGTEGKDAPVTWSVEAKGDSTTNKYWRMTIYCGQLSDKFSVKKVNSAKCASNGGKQWILVRDKKDLDTDHKFVRHLGCGDQGIRIVQTKASKYNKKGCDFPSLLKYAFDYDCNWESGVTPVHTHTLSNEFLGALGSSNTRWEEECAQQCNVRNHGKHRQTSPCQSWVVERFTSTSATCMLSDSFVLRPRNSLSPQNSRYVCGNIKFFAGGKPHQVATPAPTALGACSSYTTSDACPAEKCEWSTGIKGDDFSTDKLGTAVCQDAASSCGGDMFSGLTKMMGGGLGDVFNKFMCNIVSVVKAVFGMVASFKQSPAGGVLQAVEHLDEASLAQTATEWAEENGIRMSELKLDHNDEPVESFPTAFPEPAKRDKIQADTAAVDVGDWRSHLKQDASARQR